jgi:hypothetical protein
VDKALPSVTGTASACDKDAGTLSITAPNNATAQKAVNAFMAGG